MERSRTPSSDLTGSEVTPKPSSILPTTTPPPTTTTSLEPISGSARSSTRPQRSTPPSHAQLRKKPMKPSSSTRKTSPTPSPSEPAECETSLPELPTAKHSNNSTLFLTFNCIDKNNKIFVLKKKKKKKKKKVLCVDPTV